MEGLAAVDLGVANDSVISLDNLDLNAINSLLLITNQEHRSFLITEKGKPLAAIVPVDEYQKNIHISKKLNELEMISLLDEYEEELENIV